MITFSLFTDAHLAAAEARYADDFAGAAEAGYLNSAECAHGALLQVRAEIARRAGLTQAEAA